MRRLMIALYSGLIRLYPKAFRDRLGGDMQLVFEQAWTDVRQQGRLAMIAFCLRELSGLVVSILNARLMTQEGSAMFRLLFRPYTVIALLLITSVFIAAVVSMNYWGYLFAPPSPASVTSPIQAVDSLHLVQFDSDYQVTAIPVTKIPLTAAADYPPSRILPALADRLHNPERSTALDSTVSMQVSDALRNQQLEISPMPDYSPVPRYCVASTGVCYDDASLLPANTPYYWQNGYQLESYGGIRVTYPVLGGVTAPERQTEQYVLSPKDGYNYFSVLGSSGYVIQGRDAEDNPVALVNLTTTLSNDHYGYTEMLFDVGDNGLELRSSNSFQYDVAGIEGFTFPVISLGVFVPLVAGWLLLMMIWAVLRIITGAQPPRKTFA